MSYEKATGYANGFLHRSRENDLRKKTVEEFVERTGREIDAAYARHSDTVLSCHGIDTVTGIPDAGSRLDERAVSPSVTTMADKDAVREIAIRYNENKEISLPLVSYISAMRLDYNGQPMFYLKLFADFEEIEKRKAFIENYGAFKQEEEETFFGVREETVEEKKPIVKYGREGQDEYRRKLLEECPFCPITMINEESLLIASHIKPWAVSDSKERIDPNNGFILSPLYDKLFDRGYITFSDDKRVSISNWLSRQVKDRIGIKENQMFQFLLLPLHPWNKSSPSVKECYKGTTTLSG